MAEQIHSDHPPARRIILYGNSDLHFPTPDDFTQYIRDGIFSIKHHRYRYSQQKNADLIVLSRKGEAFGHFEIEQKIPPNDKDRAEVPGVKSVYLVRKSFLYKRPIPLDKKLRAGLQFGRALSEIEFQHLLQLAEGIEEFPSTPSLPQATADLEQRLREVRQRLGQSDFRKALIANYNARCAVTGCDAIEALEAAHIAPYGDIESNHPSNGLLLRADIHTLFDADLIGFDPCTSRITLGSTLVKTSYSELQGKPLAPPSTADGRPNNQALEKRWQQFLAKSKSSDTANC